jgi:hypothetical protein
MPSPKPRSLTLDRVLQGLEENFIGDGFFQVGMDAHVVGPVSDGGIAAPGDQNDGQLECGTLRRRKKIEAGGVREMLVEDEALPWTRVVASGEGLHGSVIFDSQTVGLEKKLEGIPHGIIVFHDEDCRKRVHLAAEGMSEKMEVIYAQLLMWPCPRGGAPRLEG